jgi:hypothetical protein
MLHLPFPHHQSNGDLVLGRLWRFPISPFVRVTASARTAYVYTNDIVLSLRQDSQSEIFWFITSTVIPLLSARAGFKACYGSLFRVQFGE